METAAQTTETQATETPETTPAAPTTAKSAQKEAVFQFALDALGVISLPEGQPLKSAITKEVRKAIRAKLFAGARAGTIKLKRPMDDSKLRKYCSSLINNWLKKDPRFN